MPDISEAAVREALDRIVDPCSIATGVPISLVDMGLIKEITIDGSNVHVTLRLTSPLCFQSAKIAEAIERNVTSVHGVGSVTCTIDTSMDWMPSMIAPYARHRLRQIRPILIDQGRSPQPAR
jgi:metal-sulfur cluster biosynthetic enzyme